MINTLAPRTTTERCLVFILQRSSKHESAVVFTRIFLNVEIIKVHFLIHTLAPKLHTQHWKIHSNTCFIIVAKAIEVGSVWFLQELMSQMEEHNSTHTLLSAQMKNLNVRLLLNLNFYGLKVYFNWHKGAKNVSRLSFLFLNFSNLPCFSFLGWSSSCKQRFK